MVRGKGQGRKHPVYFLRNIDTYENTNILRRRPTSASDMKMFTIEVVIFATSGYIVYCISNIHNFINKTFLHYALEIVVLKNGHIQLHSATFAVMRICSFSPEYSLNNESGVMNIKT